MPESPVSNSQEIELNQTEEEQEKVKEGEKAQEKHNQKVEEAEEEEEKEGKKLVEEEEEEEEKIKKKEEKEEKTLEEEKIEKKEKEKEELQKLDHPKDNAVKTAEPSASAPAQNSVKSGGLEYLVEAMLRQGSSTVRSPKLSVLKRGRDERIIACEKVMEQINSVDFCSLNDKEIRTFLMIREISNAVVNGHRKLPTDGDVSRVLKASIERLALLCRKIAEQVSGMDLEDLTEEEKQSLTMILTIAHAIVYKQGAQLEGD